MTSSELCARAEAFADRLRVRLVADALGVAERALLELRVSLTRRLAKHAQRFFFIDSTSEADVLPTGGLRIDTGASIGIGMLPSSMSDSALGGAPVCIDPPAFAGASCSCQGVAVAA